MIKSKYALSKSSVDELMSKLEVIAKEQASEDVDSLLSTPISTDFLRKVAKVRSVAEVIDRNEELSKTYTGLLSLYGFESMYDMYIYARSCDSLEELTKGKDYSKLVPVKRKIIRNGKETEVTVYEDPNKDDKDGKESGSGSGKGRKGGTAQGAKHHARDLTASIISDKDAADPKTVAKLKQQAQSLPKGNKEFSDTSQFYTVLKGDNGDVYGIIGYSEEGDFLVMDFYRSNGEVAGVAALGFFKLLDLARTREMGLKVEDQEQARPLFAKTGMTHKDGHWSITHEELVEVFGEKETKNG